MIPRCSHDTSCRPRATRAVVPLAVLLALVGLPAASAGLQSRGGELADGCRILGVIRSGGTALPGVWLVVHADDRDEIVAATSTRRDGSYELSVPDGGSYNLSGALAGFSPFVRDLARPGWLCDGSLTLDVEMALLAGDAVPSEDDEAWTPPRAPDTSRLEWEWEFADAAVQLGLPPGFWSDRAPTTIAIVGDAMAVDRSRLRTRLQAVAAGEIVLASIAPGDLMVAGESDRPAASLAAADPPAGRGGGAGGRGGAAGGRGNTAGGRTVTPQRPYQATLDYTLRGSMLESPPFQLRPERPAEKRPYTRQNFSLTVGGPIRIPGVYDGGSRTNFTLTYSGDRGSNLFDQYSTVPSPEMQIGRAHV